MPVVEDPASVKGRVHALISQAGQDTDKM